MSRIGMKSTKTRAQWNDSQSAPDGHKRPDVDQLGARHPEPTRVPEFRHCGPIDTQYDAAGHQAKRDGSAPSSDPLSGSSDPKGRKTNRAHRDIVPDISED
jgi:hypothetical protein